MAEQKFEISSKKGFKITFSNGLTLSVQFGRGNYCGDYGKTGPPTDMIDGLGRLVDVLVPDTELQSCQDAEIAIIGHDGTWRTKDIIEELEDDDVIGYITPDRLAEIIPLVKNYKVESEAEDG